MKISYQVSRIRLGRGSHPLTADLRSLPNYRDAAIDNCDYSRTEALARPQCQDLAPLLASPVVVKTTVAATRRGQKQYSEPVVSVADSESCDRFRFTAVFQLINPAQILFAACEILKQFADRNKYNSGEVNSRIGEQTLTDNSRCLRGVEIELSGSEAKFFLDRNSGRENIDRKIFGDYSERAKFHLQAFGNLLNWRSYVLGWEGVSLYAHESARLRKAVSPKQGLSTQTNHQHQASGNKRLLGFFSIPG